MWGYSLIQEVSSILNESLATEIIEPPPPPPHLMFKFANLTHLLFKNIVKSKFQVFNLNIRDNDNQLIFKI